MTITADLYALQEIDSALDACERELEQIRTRLGESEAVQDARVIIAEQDARRRAAEVEARRLETAMLDLQEKIRPVETRLYDGSVRNPKELEALQEDVDMLRRQQRGLEDQQLALMEELEVASAGLNGARAEAEAAEAAWRADQGNLALRQQELEADRARLQAQREQRAARIPPPNLAQYERLRRSKRGLAVVRVERGACQGCRIALPTTVQQRARSGMQVVQCTSCERILYTG